MPQREKILVVSHNPQLAYLRKTILEDAGFEVLAATDPRTAGRTCAKHNLRLVVVGHSLLPAAKRRVCAKVREHCDVPVLELHQEREPQLMPPAFFHVYTSPNHFLET